MTSVLACVSGSEDQALLYTAEIVSAVSHLHNRGIVHRDLKPENILMDADGHVNVMPLYSNRWTEWESYPKKKKKLFSV